MLLLLLLCLPCRADGLAEGLGAEQAGEGLPADAAEALEGLSVTDTVFDSGLERVWAFLRAHLEEAAAEVLRPVAAVLAVTVLCALGEQFVSGGAGKFDYVSFGSCLAIAAAAVADVKSVVSMGGETIQDLCDYSRILLPTLATAAAGAGAPTSAGAKYAAAALFSDLLLTAADRLVLPLICAYTAVVIVQAALGTRQLSGAAKLLQWGAKNLMKWLVGAFTAFLGLTGVFSGTADTAAVKTAKTVLSTALPVVGRALSDASEALVSGAALIRNAIGAFGLLAVLAAVALPVLRLGLRYLLYKAAAALAEIVAGGRLSGLIDGIGNAYGMVLGLVGAGAAFAFLSIISLLRTVTG